MRNLEITVSEGQTQEDLALQYYGDNGATALLREDNPGLTPDTVLEAGQVLRILQDPIDASIVDYYANTDQVPNTGGSAVQPPTAQGLQQVLQSALG